DQAEGGGSAALAFVGEGALVPGGVAVEHSIGPDAGSRGGREQAGFDVLIGIFALRRVPSHGGVRAGGGENADAAAEFVAIETAQQLADLVVLPVGVVDVHVVEIGDVGETLVDGLVRDIALGVLHRLEVGTEGALV